VERERDAPVLAIRHDRAQPLHDLHPARDPPEDGVLAVEVRCRRCMKLRPASEGVRVDEEAEEEEQEGREGEGQGGGGEGTSA